MKQHSFTSSSKEKNVFIKNLLVFAVAFAVMLTLAHICVCALEKITDDRSSTQKISKYQIEDFYALEEESLDILFMGSSHAMCTYNPYTFGEYFSASAYNLGTALQQPDTAYYLLREVYKTQSPKVLVYDFYFKVMECEKTREQAETVLMELKPSVNSGLFWLNNLDMEGRVSFFNNRVNPFGRLYSIFSDWKNARNSISEPRNINYRGRGFYVTESVVSEDLLADDKHPFPRGYEPFTERQKKYLKKLVELAQSHGTRVVFVTAPLPPTILGRIDYYRQMSGDAQMLAESMGVSFFDFGIAQLDGRLVIEDCDFADQGHLNLEGTKKFNEFLLEENYDFTEEIKNYCGK